MHPGIVTTENVQSEIVKSINEKKVKYIVLFDMPESREHNLSSVSSRVVLLDEFIDKNFHTVFVRGGYKVLVRN